MTQQPLHDGCVALVRRDQQRCVAICVLNTATYSQLPHTELHRMKMAAGNSVVEQTRPIIIYCVGRRTPPQELAYDLQASIFGCNQHGVRTALVPFLQRRHSLQAWVRFQQPADHLGTTASCSTEQRCTTVVCTLQECCITMLDQKSQKHNTARFGRAERSPMAISISSLDTGSGLQERLH